MLFLVVIAYSTFGGAQIISATGCYKIILFNIIIFSSFNIADTIIKRIENTKENIYE